MHHDTRDIQLARGGGTAVVSAVVGFFCDTCDEVYFDETTDSATRYAAAGDILVRATRQTTAKKLKEIRLKLNLTTAQASLLAGGDSEAFSTYESGVAQPTAAVLNLFALLDRHPEMLNELDFSG